MISSSQLLLKKPASAPSTAPRKVDRTATTKPMSKAVFVLYSARSNISCPIRLVPNQNSVDIGDHLGPSTSLQWVPQIPSQTPVAAIK